MDVSLTDTVKSVWFNSVYCIVTTSCQTIVIIFCSNRDGIVFLMASPCPEMTLQS
jgi:hypothetical protein